MEEAPLKTKKVVSGDPEQTPLTAILYLLQDHLEKFKDEVDRSYELHKVGEKTPLTNQIEKTFKNPLGNLHTISTSIEVKCYELLDIYAIRFFSTNKDVLGNVYRAKNKIPLHYSIVLKEDTINHRNTIFHFFDMPPIRDVIYKFPILFQFTKESSLGNIGSSLDKVDF